MWMRAAVKSARPCVPDVSPGLKSGPSVRSLLFPRLTQGQPIDPPSSRDIPRVQPNHPLLLMRPIAGPMRTPTVMRARATTAAESLPAIVDRIRGKRFASSGTAFICFHRRDAVVR